MIPSNLFSNNVNLEYINLHTNKIKYIGSGVLDQIKMLTDVYLSANICVNEYFSDINQLKHDIKSKCYNPNDQMEKITNLKQEIKELNTELKNGQDVLKEDQDALK